MRFLRFIFNNNFFKFLLGGIFNTLTSSLVLILLLEITTIGAATLLSDIYYSFSAYLINSKNIFKKKGYLSRYILFVTLSWLLEWFLLKSLIQMNLGKIVSVLILVPFFALGSYLIQKYIIFKKINSLKE